MTKRAACILISLALMLSGCFEKSFENKNISFKGSGSLDVYVGETKTLTAVLPDNGVETSLSVACDSEILTAAINDAGELTLTGNQAGECSITFTLSAEGYKPADASYPVRVSLRELELAPFIGGGDVSGGIPLSRGGSALLELDCNAEGAEITVASSDEARLSVEPDGGGWLLTANSSGSAEIEVAASAHGYTDLSLSIPVEIGKTEAALSLSAESVSAVTGGSVSVTCQYQPGGSITASCGSDAAAVTVEGDKVTVASQTAGSYTVTVKCEADDFITAERSFTAVFALPVVSFSAPKSLTLESGSSADISLSGYPEGTAFTATSGGKLDLSVSGGKITVTAKAAGSDSITVTAQNSGYQSSRLSIPVTINAVAARVNTRYRTQVDEIIDLVNEERADRGLSPLTYIADLERSCAIRAEEASDVWSHTRPDGRDWQTSLYDTGVSFVTGGENLLEMNALDAHEAVDAWMASPGHRANILRANFNGTCVGIYKDGSNYFYAQHFIER